MKYHKQSRGKLGILLFYIVVGVLCYVKIDNWETLGGIITSYTSPVSEHGNSRNETDAEITTSTEYGYIDNVTTIQNEEVQFQKENAVTTNASLPRDGDMRNETDAEITTITQNGYTANDDTVTNQNEGFQFQYQNAVTNFSLPKEAEWVDDFLKRQPINTHNATLSNPNEKFIVMICHKMEGGTEFEPCGGLSDRLTPLPYYVWLAHKTGRKLLIKHTKPHPLEEFFSVPEGGLDWRLPDEYCENEEGFKSHMNRSKGKIIEDYSILWHENIEKEPWKNKRFVYVNNNRVLDKMIDVFNKETGLNTDVMWPALFRRMFKPSEELGKVIDTHAQKYNLIPGEYSGAHLRARYPGEGIMEIRRKSNSVRKDSVINMYDPQTAKAVYDIADNAIHCAVKLLPNTKHVYFATDTSKATDYLLNESPKWSLQSSSNTSSSVTIVSRPNYNKGSLHIDTHVNYPNQKGIAPAKEFYQVFFDLWMLSHTKCLSQGLGGFGHFASILSGNHLTCRNRHRDLRRGSMKYCPTPTELKKWNGHAK